MCFPVTFCLLPPLFSNDQRPSGSVKLFNASTLHPYSAFVASPHLRPLTPPILLPSTVTGIVPSFPTVTSLQNFELAEEHYRKAISLQWRSPDAHYNLGCLLQHHKDDMAGAEEQYRSAIKCDPKHGMAQYNLGWVLEKVDGRSN